jgi:glycerol-3-phosphate acyltransferase PlsY
MPWGVLIAIAFLSGSIPFGLLIARQRGVDLRAHGSGNIGATNVWRVLGRGPGLACFILDALKGFAPVFGPGLARGMVRASCLSTPIDPAQAWFWLGTLAGAILGHMFSPWARFKGGKGVATGLGGALGVFPFLTIPAVFAFIIWGAVARTTRTVSLASCAAALLLPALVWAWGRASGAIAGTPAPDLSPFIIATALLGAIVIFRHRANLIRVWQGRENRLGSAAQREPARTPRGTTG